MYSVFIVDDEIIVREGIRNKIDWENSNFVLAGEAADGEIALSMIQDIKPDILITDIKMPFMDGLELSRIVKKLQPQIHIIILSGHDEFEYAKTAISIGVEDYILKPFSSNDLLSSMNKIAQKIDTQEKQFSDINLLKQQLESSATLLNQKFLTDIIMGTTKGADALSRASELHIELIARYYVVVVCLLHLQDQDDTSTLISTKSRLISIGNSNSASNTTTFSIAPEKIVFIVKGSEKESLDDDTYNIADTIIHEISKSTKITVLTAIGSVVDRTAFIPDSYRDAQTVLSRYSFINQSRTVSFDDMKNTVATDLLLPADDPLVDKLKYASVNEIDSIVQKYIDILDNNNDQFSLSAPYLFMDTIFSISKLFEELGGDIKTLMPEITTHTYVTNAVRNRDVFISEMHKILKTTFEYRDSRISGRYGDVILRAKQYIAENFATPDICLHSVAEEVHFSPNHFSMIFSQECGTTFIEYLTSVRIEHAQKLLKNTTMRSAEIAYEVGFSDPHYFSFIFKKTTGVSPREFRGQ